MSSQAEDSSPGSQSPPALERVERLADKDLSEDGVLIPARPLAQWGVSCHRDWFTEEHTVTSWVALFQMNQFSLDFLLYFFFTHTFFLLSSYQVNLLPTAPNVV